MNVVASTALWADVVHDIAGDNDHDAHGHDGDAHGHESEDPHDHDADDHADNDSDLPTNPHVWYGVATVNSFATKIADTLNDKNGDIKASTKDFSDKLHAIDEKIKALPAKKVASTESVSGYLLKESPMEDVTPHDYLSASLKESDPSAADVAEFTSLINDKKVDILVNNPQTEDSVSKDLVSAAKKAGIPVVDIYETPEKAPTTWTFSLRPSNGSTMSARSKTTA